MKKTILALAAILTFSFSVSAHGEKSKVNTSSSVMEWVGEKVSGQHNGKIMLKSGALDVSHGKVTGGSFTIDMNSITCDDIEDKEWNGKLVGHLKNDDFFGVAKHPTSTFKITKVEEVKSDKGTHKITGELTIKGITKSVSFPATIKVEGSKVEATADIVVDRTKYDIRYGSGSFFDNLGDKTISDDFKIKLKLFAE